MIRFDVTSTLSLLALIALASGCPQKQEVVATSGSTEASAEESAVGEAPLTDAEMATLKANFLRVHFEYDRAVLTEDARTALRENAEILLAHSDVGVQIEGHADHWGSDIYNLALGERRATTVKNYLVDFGVLAKQLSVISYGEERPLVGDADRLTEAPNRRAEFTVTTGNEKAASSY
ncbi:MAG: OmpA family protein [Deltaproteobacteria bacterium]|nr:OmpA family protein [Deltaproteobacteria bacterium]